MERSQQAAAGPAQKVRGSTRAAVAFAGPRRLVMCTNWIAPAQAMPRTDLAAAPAQHPRAARGGARPDRPEGTTAEHPLAGAAAWCRTTSAGHGWQQGRQPGAAAAPHRRSHPIRSALQPRGRCCCSIIWYGAEADVSAAKSETSVLANSVASSKRPSQLLVPVTEENPMVAP